MLKKSLDFSSKRGFVAADREIGELLNRAGINPRILLDEISFNDFVNIIPFLKDLTSNEEKLRSFNMSLNEGRGVTYSGSASYMGRLYNEVLKKQAIAVDSNKGKEHRIKVYSFKLLELLGILKDNYNRDKTNLQGDCIYDFTCIGISDFYCEEYEEDFLSRYDRMLIETFILTRRGVSFHLVVEKGFDTTSKFWSRNFRKEIILQNHLISI